ncbi:hypothetical protein XA68_18517 [Ophiocordyceps unilateralis]|uniref:Uncharacterized protein n=1 Tax=Ophiocordyceps unilateralis TaxID=268505 RepID=A0A2A9PJ60_OPHUN|nr:hypothetical protein XA68_18517 [Ophiocordyceps unilateralis]
MGLVDRGRCSECSRRHYICITSSSSDFSISSAWRRELHGQLLVCRRGFKSTCLPLLALYPGYLKKCFKLLSTCLHPQPALLSTYYTTWRQVAVRGKTCARKEGFSSTQSTGEHRVVGEFKT